MEKLVVDRSILFCTNYLRHHPKSSGLTFSSGTSFENISSNLVKLIDLFKSACKLFRQRSSTRKSLFILITSASRSGLVNSCCVKEIESHRKKTQDFLLLSTQTAQNPKSEYKTSLSRLKDVLYPVSEHCVVCVLMLYTFFFIISALTPKLLSQCARARSDFTKRSDISVVYYAYCPCTSQYILRAYT